MQNLAGRRWGLVAGMIACAACLVAVCAAFASTTVPNAVPAKFPAGVQNRTPNASFNSVFCVGAGDCTAVGFFKDAKGNDEASTDTETHGKWGTVRAAKFAAGVQRGNPNASFYSVSCVWVGDCTAVGFFKDANGYYEAFTETERSGKWATAEPARFAKGVQRGNPNASFYSVSCVVVGDCTAVGAFKDANGYTEAFTETETNGKWGTARPAKFAAGKQHSPPDAWFNAVSCGGVGDCTAVGVFRDAKGYTEAFKETERNGRWGTARAAKFAKGVQRGTPKAQFYSVSCAAAGDCTAVGSFTDANGYHEAFTETQTRGRWANAVPVKFASGLQQTSLPLSDLFSVSCAAPGDCTAGGQFNDAHSHIEAFTATQTNGTWTEGRPVQFAPGVDSSAPLDDLTSVSCVAVGDCTASGDFYNTSGNFEGFTQTETHGHWSNARPATFSSGLQQRNPAGGFTYISWFDSVSCGTAGSCSVVGDFLDAAGHVEAITDAVNTTRASITVTSRKPRRGIVHRHPYHPTARSTSGDRVRITIAHASRRVCAIRKGRVRFKRAGSCRLLFNDPGNRYNVAARQHSQRIRVIGPPSAPRHPTAVARSLAALITWSKPAQAGGAKVTRYVVTSLPGHQHCSTRGKRSCTVHGLQSGTGYRFTITATNAAGTGPSSRSTPPLTPLP